ncbi:unnamed protein product [Didymodactylos carnosus]|uniref:ABC transporter domain-containing protein n=1 Tax=Didymodactylos carnosus TaxID=1234261 RepID=A0A8S2HPH2_9BILA|nr:unnamed protein product [Didymodactylos carnosus]CAF3669417.1 unnamed protein product [Didymodactylos carnosus]
MLILAGILDLITVDDMILLVKMDLFNRILNSYYFSGGIQDSIIAKRLTKVYQELEHIQVAKAELSFCKTLLKLLIDDLELLKGMRHSHRNLKIDYFTQHFVDQLEMNVNCVKLLQSRFPGQPIATISLSGGQKIRFSPHIFVLDEPTNHLDMETIKALGHAIKNCEGGVILVSQETFN